MNGYASAFPAVWSRRRLWWTIVGILAVQVGLIAWWSEPEPLPRRNKPVPVFAYLILDESTQARLAQDLATLDPTLFALPHARNFSGSAWLNLPKMNREIEDWPDHGPPLALDPGSFSSVRTLAERAFRVAYPVISDKPEPRWFESSVPPEPFPNGTQARIEGELAVRGVVFMPEWQAWPHNDLMANTVVQLWVDAEGLVRDVGLWTECGVPEADRYALREAKRIRLQPLSQGEVSPDPSRLSMGTLSLRWGTIPISATNQVRPSP